MTSANTIHKNMTQKYMNFNDVTVVNIGRNDYMIHFWSINKSDSGEQDKKNDDLGEKKWAIMMTKKI